MCAETVTTHYGMIKPEISGSPTTWGVKLNADLDIIDAQLFANAKASEVIVAPNEILLNTAAAPAFNGIYGQAAGVNRWGFYLGDGEAETGGNAGSNLLIQAYSDSGGFLSNAFEIIRATGQANFGAALIVNGAATFYNTIYSSGAVTFNNTLNVGGAATFNSSLNVGGAATFISQVGASYFVVNGSSTALFNGYLQFAPSYTITGGGGAIGFNGPSGELAEMDNGGSFGITGQGYKPGGGSWANSSDARVKNVERSYALGLDEVLRLNPIVYRFKGNDAAPGKASKTERVREKRFVGLVAQDVEGVFPGMVTRRKGYVDGQEVDDLRDIDTSELIYALVNAVKTLTKRVEELEAR